MLKRKLSKADFDALNDVLKVEYKEKGGEYHLDYEQDEDTSSLLRAKNRETEKRKELEVEVNELKTKFANLDSDSKRKIEDISHLEKSWKEKHTTEVNEIKSKLEKTQIGVAKKLSESTCLSIASEISKRPAMMAKLIADRVAVEFIDDEPHIKILDAKGKVSALTIDDLKKEIVAHPDYADIIVGSKASGGRAPNNSVGDQTQSKPLAQMTPKELSEHLASTKNG